jgi:hypothetical protein
MSAESTTKSLANLDGNSIQLSAQAVAHPSTVIENLSKKQLIVLLHLFQQLLNFTYSPDARYLSIKAAVNRVKHLMPEEEAKAIAEQLMCIRQSQMADILF